ncbi:3-methyl-2-oxobutanoate hydroxymethyltransferase [Streptomyces sp. NPDC048409]|uniref:3-methyl-2-oxobutanoate hydroxymethyltransferase n=1 Tax=Streptomyces sp. NPDC048409 TaxID=3154723 RepID=UPI00342420B4
MSEDLRIKIKNDYEERTRTGAVGLKVNLYTEVDVAALNVSLSEARPEAVRLECLMVGDSILSTHHGRDTTRLDDEQDQRWAYEVLRSSVSEVASAMKHAPAVADAYLMADLPDGCLTSRDRLLRASEGFLDAGADVVKLEVGGLESLEGLRFLAAEGIPVFGHLGFTPQTARLRRHGKNNEERRELYSRARDIRDSGACGLILEMIDPLANAALSTPSPEGLPCFSIFCGPAVAGGGLSVNAWDAVFRHPTGASGFPPSAFLDTADYPEHYTQDNVSRGLTSLLTLIDEGRFPARRQADDAGQHGTEESPWKTVI